MDDTINALGGILLNAVPTLLLLIFLYIYLKSVFFTPMERVLRERDDATKGARRSAQESLTKAEAKAAEYEETLRQARNEVYKEQEEIRKRLKAQQDVHIAEAARQSKSSVQAAKDALAAEVASARAGLEAESRMLASRIADTILDRRHA
ncbi:MAG: hypothetical protein HY820_11535 [Acidobacteria bacterium]|nr:hypothetical protein [Acidobacteriota bacterium]